MSNRALTKARKDFMSAARNLDVAQRRYDFSLASLKANRKILNRAKIVFRERGTNLSVEEMN